MRIARLYQKTMFGVFAIIGLIVALTSALYVYTVDRQLTGDFLKNSRAIARSIANSNVDLIVHRNYSALQSIIDQFVEISSISYVFVVDEKGPFPEDAYFGTKAAFQDHPAWPSPQQQQQFSPQQQFPLRTADATTLPPGS